MSINSLVIDPQDLGNIPIDPEKAVYLRDLGRVEDGADMATGFALVNGRRSIYMPIVKTADASTLSVVNGLKENLDRMHSVLPEDVKLTLEFDQSPYVTGAVDGVIEESALGAVLTGLMVLLFLRDWRSVIVVLLTIPLALMGAVFGLWMVGQTINLMTLGGLSLAVGILVDEATVVIENIHTQMGKNSFDRPRRLHRHDRDRGAEFVGHVVRSGGVFAVFHHGRRSPRPVHSPGDFRRFRHDLRVHLVDDLRPGALGLAVAPSPRGSRMGACSPNIIREVGS